MRYFIKIIILLLVVSNIKAEYISVERYHQLYPIEKKLMDNCNTLINNKAKPLKTNSKKLKIALLYPSLQLSDYWLRNKIAFEKRLKDLNIRYDLNMIVSAHIGSAILENKFIDKILKEKYDFLITTINNPLEKRLVQKVLLSSSTKVILQNITTPIKEWKTKQAFLYVGFDHRIGSLKIANYFLEKYKTGNYAVMYHTNGYVSKMRGDTFIEYINNNSKLNLVESYYTNGDKERARLATLDLLKNNKDIKFIYACSTDIAVGVFEALQFLGLKDSIEVNGWGGGSTELKMLKKKQLDVTVMRINDDAGIVMADIIKNNILNKKTPLIYSGEMKLIDSTTNQNIINDLIKKSFRYSND